MSKQRQEQLIPPDEWMEVDSQALEREYLQLGAHMARAGKLKSDARRELSLAKVEVKQQEIALEEIEAMLYLKYRNDETLFTEDSKGKQKLPTEGTINAAMRKDPEWSNAKQNVLDSELAVIDAQHTFDRCWEAMESLKIKASALNSAAADRRAEIASDPNLRKMARESRNGGEVDWG